MKCRHRRATLLHHLKIGAYICDENMFIKTVYFKWLKNVNTNSRLHESVISDQSQLCFKGFVIRLSVLMSNFWITCRDDKSRSLNTIKKKGHIIELSWL